MEVVDNHTPKSVTFSEIGPNELFEYDFRGNIAMKLVEPTKVKNPYTYQEANCSVFEAEAIVIAGPDVGKFIRFSNHDTAIYRPVHCKLVLSDYSGKCVAWLEMR